MTRYAAHVQSLTTPQQEQARPEQVLNNAGGFTFQLDKWKRLDRFLVLGSEGGTYYVDEKKLTKSNAKGLESCILEDGPRTVRRIVEISDAGRAPKNDPAIFALAMCAGANSPATRQAALAALPKVCRIGTHLFHFVNDVEGFRRWGRSLRRAVGAWYLSKTADQVAYQAVKYQQRDGWSHRDVLRLAHPHAVTPQHDATFRWITAEGHDLAKETKKGKPLSRTQLPEIIQAFEAIMDPKCPKSEAIRLIGEYKLPHECVPNELKGDPKVWEALLPHMGVTAVMRNLAKMTSIGLLGPMSDTTRAVATRLQDEAELKKGRLHPLAILFALKTYQSGHGLKGSLTWQPQREIVDALDEGFYRAFQTIEPTGKRILLALDVSGSMSAPIAGTSLSCRDATAALAMVTARTEANWHCIAFTSSGHAYGRYGGMHGGGDAALTILNISPKQRLDDVVKTITGLPFGGTDCSLPWLYAIQQKIPVDACITLTDSETWAGHVHPFQALTAYRQKTGIAAKSIVVGMTADDFTIADPSDAGSLDVVGFDAATPAVMADFIADREAVS